MGLRNNLQILDKIKPHLITNICHKGFRLLANKSKCKKKIKGATEEY